MNTRLLTIVALIFAAAALRLIPHPANFAPIVALGLFAGSYLEDRRMAFAVPFGALLLSDLVLGLYPGLVFVYAGFALSVCIGFALRKRSVRRIAAGTLASALVFFVITNFGAWMTLPMYPKTPDGLLAAYVAGIPFLRNALAADALYAVLLFGGFALAERRVHWLSRPLAHT